MIEIIAATLMISIAIGCFIVLLFCIIRTEMISQRVKTYYQTGFRLRNPRSKETKKKDNPFSKLEGQPVLIPQLEEMVKAAGLEMDSNQFLILWIGAAIGLGLVAFFVLRMMTELPPALGLVGGLVIAAVGGLALLKKMQGNQLKKFNQQLSDSLPRIVSSLRSGSTFPVAVQSIAESSSEPISSEFARIKAASDVGIPIEAAIYDMSDRMNSQELILLAQAIEIQKQTGGNLSDMVDATAKKIRFRIELRATIKSITAEGRLSMWIGVIAPILMFVVMTSNNEMWSNFFFNEQMGHICIVVVIFCMVACVVLSKKMVNLKIE